MKFIWKFQVNNKILYKLDKTIVLMLLHCLLYIQIFNKKPNKVILNRSNSNSFYLIKTHSIASWVAIKKKKVNYVLSLNQINENETTKYIHNKERKEKK